jgi:hypothetical protein
MFADLGFEFRLIRNEKPCSQWVVLVPQMGISPHLKTGEVASSNPVRYMSQIIQPKRRMKPYRIISLLIKK